jgi:phage FluMu protein Com
MSYTIQCVHCQAVLKSVVPVPAGKKVKCPKCQQMFTTGGNAAQPAAAPTPPAAPAQDEALADDDEMARAIAKLEAEQTFGKKPAATETKPDPAPAPPVAGAPAPDGAHSDEDEMAAAIAKLEVEQTFGTKPAPAETKSAPVVQAAPDVGPSREVTAVPEEAIPEIDDDLVVPDEEDSTSERKRGENADESYSKKKQSRADAEDDEVRSKKKKTSDDEGDEEAERSKKKKRRDEADEGAPRSQKKKRSDDEDDQDEERSTKRKSRDDDADADEPRSQKEERRDVDEDEEDDGAFTDKPRSKKATSRVDDDDDDEPRSKKKGRDDDDEDDDGPRRTDKKKKKKKAGSPMMLIVLIGGGILGLFGCCTCGIGGYFLFLSNPVVGKWEMDFFLARLEFDFYRGGTGKLTTKAGGDEATVFFDYKLTGSDPMIMELKATRFEAKGKMKKDQAMFQRPARFRVNLDGDFMTLTEMDPQGPINLPLRLRRVH